MAKVPHLSHVKLAGIMLLPRDFYTKKVVTLCCTAKISAMHYADLCDKRPV